MTNTKTVIEEWSVKDLEDNSSINLTVLACSELGNENKPGLQLLYMGNIVNFEPLAAERWAYQARKMNAKEFLLENHSWMVHEDQFVKIYLVIEPNLKAKVEVKTRSSKIISKEYDLPFTLD